MHSSVFQCLVGVRCVFGLSGFHTEPILVNFVFHFHPVDLSGHFGLTSTRFNALYHLVLNERHDTAAPPRVPHDSPLN